MEERTFISISDKAQLWPEPSIQATGTVTKPQPLSA